MPLDLLQADGACERLPMDIIKHILSYDSRFVIRNGEKIYQIRLKDRI
jgi:hypothetical protein